MSEIKTGLWQSTLDGSYINVRRDSVFARDILYSEEGCGIVHRMSAKELTDSYEFRESNKPAPVIDIAIGSPWLALKCLEKVEVTDIKVFDDGVDDIWFAKDGRTNILTRDKFLNSHTPLLIDGSPAPVVDDTFNDDTPAQTFGDIQWDMGTDEKSVKVAVCLTCDAKMPEDSLDFYVVNQGLGCPHCKANAGKMRLIGIAGQARAGKDTLASYMLDNLDGEWSRSSFADPLKEMLRAIGIDCSDDKKSVEDNDYGTSPRYMMQTLGTEWGRNLIDGDIWVKAFTRMNAGKCVIVPDVRFENEAELVRANGVLIHLVGRGGIDGNHVSENAIEFKSGDIVIDNSRDLAWLHGQVDGNAVLSEFISAE